MRNCRVAARMLTNIAEVDQYALTTWMIVLGVDFNFDLLTYYKRCHFLNQKSQTFLKNTNKFKITQGMKNLDNVFVICPSNHGLLMI